MSNQLKMAKIQAILELHQQRWSQRRIARELHISRETVSRYLRLAAEISKPAIVPAGSEGENPAIVPAGPEGADPAVGVPSPAALDLAALLPPGIVRSLSGPRGTGRPSLCEPFRAVIVAALEQGLTAQRIYQDLVTEHGYANGYDSVKRFVRSLGVQAPLPMRRMERDPGTEVQVDFGTGAPVFAPEGQRRTTYVFRMVLSHSRKGFSEATHRQTTEDFLRCLENAFWHFGGVPQTVVIDNLKAAVHQADWYDPELSPKLQSFCRHYGTVILPTKVRTPRHKGKIERGIGYVKGNALKGRKFTSLEEQNRHLAHWEAAVADRRIHGTTRQQVGKVFAEVERAALRPLPAERFPFFQEARRSVNRDGHIDVGKAYYSVPPEYVGRIVWARWDNRLVRVFNERLQQIALHLRREPGRFSTQSEHIPREKINGIERGAKWLLIKVSRIGPHTKPGPRRCLRTAGSKGCACCRDCCLSSVGILTKHWSGPAKRPCPTAPSGCARSGS